MIFWHRRHLQSRAMKLNAANNGQTARSLIHFWYIAPRPQVLRFSDAIPARPNVILTRPPDAVAYRSPDVFGGSRQDARVPPENTGIIKVTIRQMEPRDFNCKSTSSRSSIRWFEGRAKCVVARFAGRYAFEVAVSASALTYQTSLPLPGMRRHKTGTLQRNRPCRRPVHNSWRRPRKCEHRPCKCQRGGYSLEA